MKLAIVGSRSIVACDLGRYMPRGVTEIVSGGAKGIDTLAAAYAAEHGIMLREFLPDYKKYGRAAPIVRNREIAAYADEALVFWDGVSKGTKHTIEDFKKLGKLVKIVLL